MTGNGRRVLLMCATIYPPDADFAVISHSRIREMCIAVTLIGLVWIWLISPPGSGIDRLRGLSINAHRVVEAVEARGVLRAAIANEHLMVFAIAARGEVITDDRIAALAAGMDSDFAELSATCRQRLGLTLAGTQVTGRGLTHVRHLTGLRILLLPQTTTDADVAAIASMTELEQLGLSGSHVTDDGLRHVAQLVSLRRLYLDRTQVTDDGLAYLEGLSQLEVICLDDTQITDPGLMHLAHLAGLRTLQIRRTQVTENGISAFQAVHAARIVH